MLFLQICLYETQVSPYRQVMPGVLLHTDLNLQVQRTQRRLAAPPGHPSASCCTPCSATPTGMN